MVCFAFSRIWKGVWLMKLLKVKARGFKNCADGFEIDFVARARKTSEDKEYELQEIAEDLFVYNTVAVVGKNASGKTSALELLDWCYDILGLFQLKGKKSDYKNVLLEMIFYEKGELYKYQTTLDKTSVMDDQASFKEQRVWHKKYYKSKINSIYDENWEELLFEGELPETLSVIFFVLKKIKVREIFYGSFDEDEMIYSHVFKDMELFKIENALMEKIIRIFDSNLNTLKQLDENTYEVVYRGETKRMSDEDLFHFLSSGTTKGIMLYILAAASLRYGFDLVVDEIENHFHKTLVENLITLYKDKRVNKKCATLIFSTHYCELLDLFNRSDNIWITHSEEEVVVDNMYEKYNLRSELLKSKKFYHNFFGTAVNYEALMDLKRILVQ